MRKILTHFSRIFAKIAKEIKYFNLPTYSAIHYRRFVWTKSCNFLNKILNTYIWNPNIFMWNWLKVFIAIKSNQDFCWKVNILSVKSTFLLKRLLKSWSRFHELFFKWEKTFFYTVPFKQLLKSISRKKKRKKMANIWWYIWHNNYVIWRKNVQLRPGLRNWFHEKKIAIVKQYCNSRWPFHVRFRFSSRFWTALQTLKSITSILIQFCV